MLTVGSKAPAFTAKAHDGSTVNLNVQPEGSLTKGKYGVLLWFYPRASTGG